MISPPSSMSLHHFNKDIMFINQDRHSLLDSVPIMKSSMMDGGYVIKEANATSGRSLVTQDSAYVLSDYNRTIKSSGRYMNGLASLTSIDHSMSPRVNIGARTAKN
jgi:hypothetical protein